MHTLGKVLLGFVVLGALGAVLLTSKAVAVRNSWQKQVADLKALNETNAEEIAAKSRQMQQLEAELTRAMLGWNKYWTDVNVAPANLNEAMVQTNNLGTNQGLGVPERPEAPVVHLFRPTADGEFIYVGPFEVTTPGENQVAMKATWRPRPGRPQLWDAGSWRVRSMIPAAHVDRFMSLQTELTELDEILAQKEQNIVQQNQLIEIAQRDLSFRTAELIGGPESPIEGGLMGAINREEQQRNTALAQVDNLRRELSDALSNQQLMIRQNQNLVEKLRRPTPAVATRPTSE